MKFLVISKPNGNSHGLAVSEAGMYGQKVQALVDSEANTIEKAYAIISGGSAVIINAVDTTELATIVRSSPLFKSSNTEIIPIADASDFLAAFSS